MGQALYICSLTCTGKGRWIWGSWVFLLQIEPPLPPTGWVVAALASSQGFGERVRDITSGVFAAPLWTVGASGIVDTTHHGPLDRVKINKLMRMIKKSCETLRGVTKQLLVFAMRKARRMQNDIPE